MENKMEKWKQKTFLKVINDKYMKEKLSINNSYIF